MPSVTAILINYRGAADVVCAAQSVKLDAPDATVVVVDNSESEFEAAHLRARLPAGAVLLVAPRNLGFGAACNLAAAHAPADFYLLVNPDVRLLGGCVTRLLAAMAGNARLGAVAPRQFLDEGQQWLFSPAWLPTAVGVWARELALRRAHAHARISQAVRAESVRLWASASESGATWVRQRALSGSTMLIRHACLDPAFGLFDPRYFMFYEDSDLCVRLRRQGWLLAVVPGAQALHLWRMGAHKNTLMAQSAPSYFAKNFPNSAWLNKAGQVQHCPVLEPVRVIWPTGQPLAVPVAWQGGWSLELSPVPLFLPCVGRLGCGAWVAWPSDVIDAVEGAAVFARLAPLQMAGQMPVMAELRA